MNDVPRMTIINQRCPTPLRSFPTLMSPLHLHCRTGASPLIADETSNNDDSPRYFAILCIIRHLMYNPWLHRIVKKSANTRRVSVQQNHTTDTTMLCPYVHSFIGLFKPASTAPAYNKHTTINLGTTRNDIMWTTPNSSDDANGENHTTINLGTTQNDSLLSKIKRDRTTQTSSP